jgi:hypothetical protein
MPNKKSAKIGKVGQFSSFFMMHELVHILYRGKLEKSLMAFTLYLKI